MVETKYQKIVGNTVLSTHEGSGLKGLFHNEDNFGEVIQTIKASREQVGGQPMLVNALRTIGREFKDLGKVPAAVKITFEDGREAIAIGLKQEGDQQPLEVRLVQLPNGKKVEMNNPITLEFDKKSDPAKGMVKGAVSNDSAVVLINEVSNLIDGKSRNKAQESVKFSAISDDILKQAANAVKPDGGYVSQNNPAIVAKNAQNQQSHSV